MITENLINKTAQRLYKNINLIDVFLEENKLNLPLDEYNELIKIRENKKYFLVFLESSVRENKVSQINFEKEIMPIITICDSVEKILT